MLDASDMACSKDMVQLHRCTQHPRSAVTDQLARAQAFLTLSGYLYNIFHLGAFLSGFGFRVSGFEFRVQGLGLRI